MPYNLHGAISTLTDAERSREALKLLDLLAREPGSVIEQRLSPKAKEFLNEMWLKQDLLKPGQLLIATDSQLFWLRDIWAKFA